MGRQSRRVNKRTTMKTLLFVTAFLAMALAAPHVRNYYDYYDYDYDHEGRNYYSNCECSEITLLDSRTKKTLGNCITAAPRTRKYYCYVSHTSDCPDKRESQRADALYYSYEACDLRGNVLVAASIY